MSLPAFAAGAAIATGAAIRAAQVGALDDGPEYIRDGEPSSPLDAVGLFAARQACKVYANDPGRLNDRPAGAYERVCRPFLDNIGYGGGPGLVKPFNGGQCPGVSYVVGGKAPPPAFRDDWTVIVTGPGPVTLVSSNETATGGFPNTRRTDYVFAFQDGPRSFFVLHSDSVRPGFLVLPSDPNQPDICGNPPPDYTEPVPPDEPETGPRPFIFAPDFNFDVDVNVDVDGRISIDIGTGPIVIDPFGEDGDDDGGGGGPGAPSPPAPEAGPELPGGNGGFGGDDDFGPPPAGRRWVGCCIRIVQKPDNSGIIVGSQPEDVYPSVVGNIRLVCNAGGLRVVDTPVRILAKQVCVWEPVAKLNPTGVNVDLLPGFGYVFTPYSVPLED